MSAGELGGGEPHYKILSPFFPFHFKGKVRDKSEEDDMRKSPKHAHTRPER